MNHFIDGFSDLLIHGTGGQRHHDDLAFSLILVFKLIVCTFVFYNYKECTPSQLVWTRVPVGDETPPKSTRKDQLEEK